MGVEIVESVDQWKIAIVYVNLVVGTSLSLSKLSLSL